MELEPSNLPAQIADALVSIPRALTPGVVKALDRLLGSAVDVPVAWLAQKKARIDAQTESYKLVEAAIAETVASDAGADLETTQRAMNVLVRKEYRKQKNREAVAAAMVEDMREFVAEANNGTPSTPETDLDEDWLNVFERYAEDASSDRLQGLWGRVLAGEIRRPGRFSTRSLRFLSEFSQADALSFESFSRISFGDAAPKSLAKPDDKSDIRQLIYLESSGLVQGASGVGLQHTLHLNSDGYGFIFEGSLAIVFKGEPNSKVSQEVVALTPLGQELLSLVAGREARDAARAVANAMRVPAFHECYIGVRVRSGANEKVEFMEIVWKEDKSDSEIVEGTIN